MADLESTEQKSTDEIAAARKRKRIRRLIIAGGVICIVVLAVFILPRHAARYVVAGELDEMGIVHQGVDTIDIDLWEQQVRFGPMQFKMSDADPGQIGLFSLKLRLANLFSRRAVVENVVIEGVDLKVHRTQDGAITINGVSLQEFAAKEQGEQAEPSDDDPWHAALEKLQVRNSRAMLTQDGAGELTVAIARLDLNGFRTWEPEKPGLFDLDATVNGIAFKWRGEARPFSDKITLAVDARVDNLEIAKIEKFIGPLGFERRAGVVNSRFKHDVALHKNGRIDAKTKGRVEVANADIALPGEGGATYKTATLDLDATASVMADKAVDLKSNLSVAVRDIRAVTPDGPTVTVGEFILKLPDLVAKVAADKTVKASVAPSLSLGRIAFEGPATARIDSLATSLTKVEVSQSSDGMSLDLGGSTDIKGLAASLPAAADRPEAEFGFAGLKLSIETMKMLAGQADPSWQLALSVAMQDLKSKIAKGTAADVSVRSLEVKGVKADQTLALKVAEFLLGGVDARFTDKIAAAGGANAPANKTSDAPATTAEAPQAADAPKISLDRFALLDTAKISFKDASVSPEVEAKVGVETLELKNLNSQDLDQKSLLKLKAKINEFTGLAVDGWAMPFRSKPDFDLKVKLTGLELPRFSAYAAKAVGMNVESGQLNLDTTAKAKGAALDAKVDVNLKDLEFGDLSEEDAKKLSGAVGMPIQTAIGLLQDSDKAINLAIPVGGTLAKPEYDLSDAIQQAVGGALTSLFPPTAIASMLISAGKGGVKFKPIPFEAGSAKLQPAGQNLAKNVAQLMIKRPKLSLRVCGLATAGDLAVFGARMIEQQRVAQRLAEAAKPKSPAPVQPVKGTPAATAPPKIVLPDAATILKAAKKPMSKLALDRTRALRKFIAAQDAGLKGRVAECRSAFNPKDKKAPRANVTL